MSDILQTKKAFYLFDSKKITKNYEKILKTFSKEHRTSVAYSFKTNSHPLVLQTLKELGAVAEVVSPYEYEVAKSFGFKKIIYNGVIKDEKSFIECSANGGKVNIDNAEDLKIALSYFESENRPLKIGARLNFDIQNGIKSHFGINVESKLFEKLIELEKCGKIIVNGLHCHFTQARELETWKIRSIQMKKYAKFFPNIEYLDFGGNMYAMHEKNIMEEYAKILSKDLSESIELIIEPGTPIVSDAFSLVSNITHIKDGFVLLDCSKFDLGIHAQNDKCKIIVEKNPKISDNDRTKVENVKLVGYTCMENDVLKKSFSGLLTIGDKIIFKNVGDYSICWTNDFILPPREVKDKEILSRTSTIN